MWGFATKSLTTFLYQVVDIVNEEWDFIVIDDLFWSFGFALTTLKHRLWELNGMKGHRPHIIVYATAASSLISAESTRSVGNGIFLFFGAEANSGAPVENEVEDLEPSLGS